HREWEAVSRRIVRREDGAGIPSVRDGHVRAAGLSERLPYPGGPPTRPYDNTGYTLAYMMGVHFDRILDAFNGPFETVNGLATPPAGTVADAGGAAGFLFSHAENDAFTVVNRLLKNH